MTGTGPLEQIVPGILERFAAKNTAREHVLAASRVIIRNSANAIRAVHRGEFDAARRLIAEARATHDATTHTLQGHADVYHAGFLHDAQKEYVEAVTTLHLCTGDSIPDPAQLRVEDTAYLNGIGEAVGELRRVILDRLRAGRFDGCEALLAAMDDIYNVLVTIDYPDAMTGGLRRTTDQ
ncbi:MAG: haloacid dehalogenase, partial [Chloroflexota bacterium]